jgi:hypothetical protein
MPLKKNLFIRCTISYHVSFELEIPSKSLKILTPYSHANQQANKFSNNLEKYIVLKIEAC